MFNFAKQMLLKSVMNMGIKFYNKSPYKIRDVEQMRQFKTELWSFLLQHTLYSVDEYILC